MKVYLDVERISFVGGLAMLASVAACTEQLDPIESQSFVVDFGTIGEASAQIENLPAQSDLELRDMQKDLDGLPMYLLGNEHVIVFARAKFDCPSPRQGVYLMKFTVTPEATSAELPSDEVERILGLFGGGAVAAEDVPECAK